MKDNLKEIDDVEKNVDYEKFDTDEENPQKSKKNFFTKSLLLPICLFVAFLLCLIFYISTSNPKAKTYETKCLITGNDIKECKACAPGDKLVDGKCVINHSFKAVYHTGANEQVKLFNLPDELVLELTIDGQKMDTSINTYTFQESGDHTVYVLIDEYKCYNLIGLFSGNKKVTSIEFSPSFNSGKVNEMTSMFQNCPALTHIDVTHLNTESVVYMENMFSGCTALTSLNLLNFNVGKVEKMNSVFTGCTSLQYLDLSTWKTDSMVSMEFLFSRCSSLTSIDVSNFNTKKVHSMQRAFLGCASLKSLDLSSFDTKNVRNMFGLFTGCKSLEKIDVSSFDTKKVKNIENMFKGCQKLTSIDLSNFDTKKMVRISGLFSGCIS